MNLIYEIGKIHDLADNPSIVYVNYENYDINSIIISNGIVYWNESKALYKLIFTDVLTFYGRDKEGNCVYLFRLVVTEDVEKNRRNKIRKNNAIKILEEIKKED